MIFFTYCFVNNRSSHRSNVTLWISFVFHSNRRVFLKISFAITHIAVFMLFAFLQHWLTLYGSCWSEDFITWFSWDELWDFEKLWNFLDNYMYQWKFDFLMTCCVMCNTCHKPPSVFVFQLIWHFSHAIYSMN